MAKQYIYVPISILMWGTMATLSKLFFKGLDPYYILFYTCLLATLALLLYNFKRLKTQIRSTSLKELAQMIIIGSLGVFLYNYFLQRGMAILPGQIAFVINYLWPTFILIFSTFILNERLTPGKLLAMLFSFAGVAVVATNGSLASLAGGNVKGVMFCVMAAMSYGLYTPLNKRSTYDKDFALLAACASATLLSLFITIGNGTIKMVPTLLQLTGFMLYGVGTCAIAYILWVKAVDIGNTAFLSNLAYLTPVVSLVMTHLFLGEEITFFSVAGLILIITGIIIQSIVQKKHDGSL